MSEPAAVDFRLYRLAWLPVMLAVVVLMFSLEGAPRAVQPAAPPGTFEPDRASRLAREIVAAAPDREPGSEGDEEVAQLVADQYKEVAAGATSEQTFETDVDGDEVDVRNVLLTLPGDPGHTIVVLAPRDAEHAPAAASSAAATGVLVELAQALGVAGRTKTIVFASTSGGPEGAVELLSQLPENDSVEAVIAISQPGSATLTEPFVVATSSGDRTGPIQLRRTAEDAVETQTGEPITEPSASIQLTRLAIPSGLGPQAPLIADGFDAVAISSAGERPLAPDDDGLEDLSQQSVDEFGRAVQSTIGAVDVAPAALDRGPETFLQLGDNLIPGWTIALLALTLLLPSAVAAVDGCARSARRRLGVGGALGWAAARALPFVAALAVVYLLAVVGLVPRPSFPFDPGLHQLGGRAAATFALALIAAAAATFLLRTLVVSGRAAPAAALPALGAVIMAAALVVWLANPYLALLLVPTAHVWLLAFGSPGAARRIGLIAATIAACVPVTLALVATAGELNLGASAPWIFTLMIADTQLGFAICLAACFVAGGLLGTVAYSFNRREPLPPHA